jgi:hypothetical protein
MSRKKKTTIITERNELYYARKDCPSYSKFGTPLLTDENGRYYKLAFSNDNPFSDKNPSSSTIIKNGFNAIKFYVKLPKGSPWYRQNELMKPLNFYFFGEEDIKLRLKIESSFRVKDSKTAYVFISGNDLIKLFIYLLLTKLII